MELITPLLILIGLVIGWVVLKIVLRLTMRIFTCGGLGLLIVFGIVLLVRHYLWAAWFSTVEANWQSTSLFAFKTYRTQQADVPHSIRLRFFDLRDTDIMIPWRKNPETLIYTFIIKIDYLSDLRDYNQAYKVQQDSRNSARETK